MPDNNSETTYDVFISYSHKDRDWVWKWLVPHLKQAGLAVCTDRESFDIGVRAIMNMENAVVASRRTLLVLTPNWINSQWSNYEALLTQEEDPAGFLRRTLPIMLEPCELPRRFAGLTYADFTGDLDQEEEFKRLLDAIRGVRRLPVAPPLATKISDEKSTGEEAPAKLPVFNLYDRNWSQLKRQIEIYGLTHDKQVIKLFREIERKLAKVMDDPRHPFYETSEWNDLRTAIDGLSTYQPSENERQIYFLVVENLFSIFRRVGDTEFSVSQWGKSKFLYALCLTLMSQDSLIRDRLGHAEEEFEKIELAKEKRYEVLHQFIKEKRWNQVYDIFDWFKEIDPEYRDVMKLKNAYGRRAQ